MTGNRKTRFGNLGPIDLLFAALAILSLAPLFIVRYPQCVDYLNHVARLFILAAPPAHPIHDFYTVNLHLIPNLGVEILGLPLTWLPGPETAMKCVWGVSVAGIAAGTWLLHRTLHARTQPTLLLATLLLYNLALTVGLLCFSVGTCVMLLATTYWLNGGEHPSPARLIVFNGLAGLTLCCHGAAWGALGLTVAGLHVFPLDRELWLRQGVRKLFTVAQGFVLSAAIWIGIWLTRTPEQFPPSAFGYNSNGSLLDLVLHKLDLLSIPVFSGHHALDTIVAVTLWGGILFAIQGVKRPFAARTKWTLALWGIALLLLPWRIGLSGFLDTRLTLPAGLLFVCAVTPSAWPKGRTIGFSAVVAVVVCARIAFLVPEWLRYDAGVAEFRALAPTVAEKAKILVVIPPTRANCREQLWSPFVQHIPTLMTLERNAFVSTIFASPNMQPIIQASGTPALAPENTVIRTWPPRRGSPEVARIQSHAFDYLAVRALRCDEFLPSRNDLTRIGTSRYFDLYRIRHLDQP